MLNQHGGFKGKGRKGAHAVMVGVAVALLLATGMSEPRAQGKAEPKGNIPEVNDVVEKELGKDVVLVQILRRDGSIQYKVGKGLENETIVYLPGGPVELSYDTSGADITISGRLLKDHLGVSAQEPIKVVIPSVMVQVGEATCWWSCSGPGGSSGCECVCVGGGQCPPLQ